MTEQMFACQKAPKVPAESDSDAGLAIYMVRLAMAYEDCAAQIATIRTHLEINGVRITDKYPVQSPEQKPSIFDLF